MATTKSEEAGQHARDRDVRAWDLPTRLFHWALVALLAGAYFTREYLEDLSWHIWNGYAILVLLVFRVLWGVVGSSTARFSSFVYAPTEWLRYAVDFVRRRPRRFLGHNPLGSVAALVMLAMLALQGVLGLFAYDDHDSLAGGPLASRASEETVAAATAWHLRLFYYLLAVVGVHIAANVLYVIWKGENLVTPMITGRKRGPFEDGIEAKLAPGWLALVCLMAAAVIVFGGIALAGGKPF